MLYDYIKYIFQIGLDNYFSEINVIGLENIPKDGALIICSNHSN